MLGLWLEKNQVSLRNDLPIPTPKKDEALIKILIAGICNTDLELINGYYSFTGILGHEFVGIVESGPEELIGKRVVGEINITCNACEYCLNNLKNHCINRKVLGIANKDGVFTAYVTLPIKNLHLVPETLANEEAIFTEPLAAALQIQQQTHVKPTDKVLVIGDGKLGLLISQSLILTGCELWLASRHEKKQPFHNMLNIKYVTTYNLTKKYFDIVIECTGNADGFKIALNVIKPRGRLIIKSTYVGNLTLSAATIVVNEITIIGSRCGPFEPALQLFARKLIDVKPLIENTFLLKQGLEALNCAKIHGTKKILIKNE